MTQLPSGHHLVFDLRSWWQAGSGRGEGARLNAVVTTDEHGLPMLPGRSVLGLVREAVQQAEDLKYLASGTVKTLCGSPPERRPEEAEEHKRRVRRARLETVPGCLWMDSAELPEDWRRWAARDDSRSERDALFEILSSTAIDGPTGQALDQTLRSVQVAPPHAALRSRRLPSSARMSGTGRLGEIPASGTAAPPVARHRTSSRLGPGSGAATEGAAARP